MQLLAAPVSTPELALLTSQAGMTKTGKPRKVAKDKKGRKERAAHWRVQFKSKGLAGSLGALVPGCQKRHPKMSLGKTLKAALKKAVKKKTERAAKADGPLVGQRVRLVSEATPATLKNSEQTVLKHWLKPGRVEVMAAGSLRQFSTGDIYVLTGKEVPGFEDKLPDLRKVVDSQKREAIALAGGELQFVQTGQQLESPELQASWLEIVARLQQKDSETRKHLHWIDCTALQPALCLPQVDLQPDKAELQELLKVLAPVKASKTAELILCPVHSPGHWTLLSLEKADTGAWTVTFWDSLVPGSARGHTAASRTLAVLQTCLKPEGPELTEAPQASCYVRQTDGWSCGVWVLQTAEMLVRQLRGEGRRAWSTTLADRVSQMNKWLASLKTWQNRQKPPLPPPVGPPPHPVQPGGEPLPLADPMPLPDKWGCSRCKHSQAGCDRCNPYKIRAKADRDNRKKQEEKSN